MHTQAGIGRRPAQLFADRPASPISVCEPADVERDQTVAVRLDTRRKIARQLNEGGLARIGMFSPHPSPLAPVRSELTGGGRYRHANMAICLHRARPNHSSEVHGFRLRASDFRRAELHADPARAPRNRLRPDQHARGISPFDHPLQAHPRGVRQPLDGLRRDLAEIQHHKPEPSGLQHQIERLHRPIEGFLQRAVLAREADAGRAWSIRREPTASARSRARWQTPTPDRTCRGDR